MISMYTSISYKHKVRKYNILCWQSCHSKHPSQGVILGVKDVWNDFSDSVGNSWASLNQRCSAGLSPFLPFYTPPHCLSLTLKTPCSDWEFWGPHRSMPPQVYAPASAFRAEKFRSPFEAEAMWEDCWQPLHRPARRIQHKTKHRNAKKIITQTDSNWQPQVSEAISKEERYWR